MSVMTPARYPALTPSWVKNDLWRRARAVPSLDLRFAENKSLTDATTGQNLVNFTRASSGTYVDSQGVIRTATTNLAFPSNMPTSTTQTTTGNMQANGATQITSGVVAPDGSTNGFTVSGASVTTNTSGSNNVRILNVMAAAGTHTVSMWIKTNTSSTTVTVRDATTATAFNFTTTSDWTRISATFNNTSAGNIVLLSTSGTAFDCFGVQVEQSSTVGEYIPTTSTINSAPRFDHNPVTGESLGLLVEEQRTNLLLYSACDSNWPTGGFGTPTYNLGLSALGVFSGVQVASLGQNWHSIYKTGISLTASTVYAFTLFYRAGTSGRVRLTFRNNATTTETVVNGVAGNLSVSAAFAGAATILSQYLCSDGLTYVVTGTFTPNGTSADHWYRIGPDSTTSGQTVIALGGQLEAGAFPTSYIPTTTAAATRSADVASITGTNFSSWYRQDEGTVFQSFTPFSFGGSAINQASVAFTDGTSSNLIGLTGGGGASTREHLFMRVRVSASDIVGTAFSPLILNLPDNTLANCSFAFAADNYGGSCNGGTPVQVSSGALPLGINTMSIMSGFNALNGYVRRLTFWPQRLPNATLQQITQ